MHVVKFRYICFLFIKCLQWWGMNMNKKVHYLQSYKWSVRMTYNKVLVVLQFHFFLGSIPKFQARNNLQNRDNVPSRPQQNDAPMMQMKAKSGDGSQNQHGGRWGCCIWHFNTMVQPHQVHRESFTSLCRLAKAKPRFEMLNATALETHVQTVLSSCASGDAVEERNKLANGASTGKGPTRANIDKIP